MQKRLSNGYHLARSKSFCYKKAFPQPEKGGHTWRVVTNMVKHADGSVTKLVYESNLPSKKRALRLAKILNTCPK